MRLVPFTHFLQSFHNLKCQILCFFSFPSFRIMDFRFFSVYSAQFFLYIFIKNFLFLQFFLCFLCFSDGSPRRLLCLIRPFFHRRQNPLPMRFHSTKKTPLLRKTEKGFSVCFSYIQFIEYGMEISMLVPFPISLSIKIFPLCSAAPCLTIESPKPVPPFSAERLASTR